MGVHRCPKILEHFFKMYQEKPDPYVMLQALFLCCDVTNLTLAKMTLS